MYSLKEYFFTRLEAIVIKVWLEVRKKVSVTIVGNSGGYQINLSLSIIKSKAIHT
jgi:hypothetical protein